MANVIKKRKKDSGRAAILDLVDAEWGTETGSDDSYSGKSGEGSMGTPTSRASYSKTAQGKVVMAKPKPKGKPAPKPGGGRRP
jgi:hypothetical protein